MPRLSKIGAAALAAFGWTGLSSVTASYLVVAGGGGGGIGMGGGGGAGGYLTGTTSLNPTQSYTVTVGAGGAGGTGTSVTGTSGSNSVFSTITSTGGGGGGGQSASGASGGSGGGAGANFGLTAGTGTSGQGFAGGLGTGSNSGNRGGGGGGGSSAVGVASTSGNGGNGGAGTANSISGSSVSYAGGGGGGCGRSAGTAGAGGAGGGGAGVNDASNATSGTANTGGGGGGGGESSGFVSGTPGAGGSGVVIISYVGAQQFGGGIVTSSGGNTIHTFQTSGTLSPLSSLTASSLVVAGGGGGAALGGGGGAGGYRTGSGITLDTNSIYLVTVGAGGTKGVYATPAPTNGSDSAFLTITSAGGGYGGGSSTGASVGANGGSGGGGNFANAAGNGNTPSTSPSQGNNGGAGSNSSAFGMGGGGGSSAVGVAGTTTTGGNGGAGTANSISGTSVTYAGGGGGGIYFANTPGSGSAGGGNGGANGAAGTDATANTGSGGGGGGSNGSNLADGGNGGSGIVIISYPGATQLMAGGTVTVAGGNVIHTFTSSGYLAPIYSANNSLRFRSSASAYLNRTPASAGNRQTWTWSGWVKRGTLGTYQQIFGAYIGSGTTDTNYFEISFLTDLISITGYSTVYRRSTAVYRDPSAWYHIIVAMDTTQATAANRVKVYVNGSEVTAFGTSNNPTQNTNLGINGAYPHGIGAIPANASYFDGYQTEVNFIDGQALTPNSFGTSNGLGVWQPIRYGGSYGTNGFYLPFTNTTSTTTLGYDFSPQGNNWTTNNISLTAGSTYDSMTDVPTLTSATAANYCTLNPIAPNATYAIGTLQAGNLDKVAGAANNEVQGTFGVTSGKWYFEYSFATNATRVGIATGGPGKSAIATKGVLYENSTGNKIVDSVSTAYGATFNQTNVIGVALDADANSVTFYKDNVSQGSISFTPTDVISPSIFTPNGVTITASFNAGQRPFSYTPPTGFNRLNTFNLPTPTIGATASTLADDYFNTVLYSGNNSTQNIAVGFQPDWVWSKCRNVARSHRLSDAVRGSTRDLYSDSTATEQNDGSITSFISTGFSLDNATGSTYNTSGENYVSWAWKANGAGSSNTAGSITSTVSASTTAGFSVLTYTGTGGTGTTTVGHGLGVSPSMVIIKRRNSATDWASYHTGLTSTSYYLVLNSTAAQANYGSTFISPSSSTLTIAADSSLLNTSTGTYVAYCFAPIAGYSAFGSYTGNGSTDGPFVFTGFRPRFILIKASSFSNASTVWTLFDTSRSPYNASVNELYANSSSAEGVDASGIDILSNGFKPRRNSDYANSSGQTYIYACFAENPFKYSNAR